MRRLGRFGTRLSSSSLASSYRPSTHHPLGLMPPPITSSLIPIAIIPRPLSSRIHQIPHPPNPSSFERCNAIFREASSFGFWRVGGSKAKRQSIFESRSLRGFSSDTTTPDQPRQNRSHNYNSRYRRPPRRPELTTSWISTLQGIEDEVVTARERWKSDTARQLDELELLAKSSSNPSATKSSTSTSSSASTSTSTSSLSSVSVVTSSSFVHPSTVAQILEKCLELADPEKEEDQQLVARAVALASRVRGQTSRDYNGLLAVLSKVGNAFDNVFDVLARMKAAGIQPDGGTFAQLINACFTNEKDAVFFEMLRVMEAQGIRPTYELFASSITRMAESIGDKTDKIRRLLTRMTLANLTPDSQIFERIIAGHLKRHRPVQAMAALDELGKFKVVPTSEMYNKLLWYFADPSHFSPARMVSLVVRMRKEDRVPEDAIMGKFVTTSKKRKGALRLLVRLLSDLRREDEAMANDVVVFNFYFHACLMARRIDLQQAALQEIEYRIVPNKKTRVLLMHYYISIDECEKGIRQLDKVREMGHELTADLWKGLFLSLVSYGRKHLALAVKGVMHQLGVFPSQTHTYNLLLKMCVNIRDPELGRKVIQEMRTKNVKIDATTQELAKALNLPDPTTISRGTPPYDRDPSEQQSSDESNAMVDELLQAMLEQARRRDKAEAKKEPSKGEEMGSAKDGETEKEKEKGREKEKMVDNNDASELEASDEKEEELDAVEMAGEGDGEGKEGEDEEGEAEEEEDDEPVDEEEYKRSLSAEDRAHYNMLSKMFDQLIKEREAAGKGEGQADAAEEGQPGFQVPKEKKKPTAEEKEETKRRKQTRWTPKQD